MVAQPLTLDRLVRFVVLIAVAGGLGWVVVETADVLVPVAVAMVVAYLLDPVVRVVERRPRRRREAVPPAAARAEHVVIADEGAGVDVDVMRPCLGLCHRLTLDKGTIPGANGLGNLFSRCIDSFRNDQHKFVPS